MNNNNHSGFEHVFLGEKKLGKVQVGNFIFSGKLLSLQGFHNWVYFYHLEKQGQVPKIYTWKEVDTRST